MDGVLCNFEKGAIEAINRELSSENPKNPELAAEVIKDLGRDYVTVDDIQKFSPGKSSAATKYMYKIAHDDVDFWADLEWQPGGKQLWSYIRQFDPDILTSPMDKQGHYESLEGKLIWVEKNLGLSPDKVNFAHDKYKYAVSEDGKPNFLKILTKPRKKRGFLLFISLYDTIYIVFWHIWSRFHENPC